MKNLLFIFTIALLTSCNSHSDKLLNQFEDKVTEYEKLADAKTPYGAPELDSLYSEVDAIMNELMSSDLNDKQMSRATELSLRLQVAIAGIQEENAPELEIDLNEILQGIEQSAIESAGDTIK